MTNRVVAAVAALFVLLMAGCAPAVQTPKPTHTGANAGGPGGGAGQGADDTTGPAETDVPSDEVTPDDGDTPPPTDDVTTQEGEASPPTSPQQTTLDIYWVQPLECSIVAGGGTGGADGLTIFVGLRSGGETVTSLIPVSAFTESGGNSTANAAAGTDGSTPVQVNLSAGDYGRSLGVTVTADPENTFAETDDSNNTLNITVDLPPAPASQDVPCRAS